MNNRILEDEWKPSDDVTLEDSALHAIRASSHVAIAAGPGAGKTDIKLDTLSKLECVHIPKKY